MTTTPAATVVGYADLLRDVRHLDARAASDLEDWLAWLEVAGKRDRTLYAYMRTVAGLLNTHPDKTQAELTAADITGYLASKPQRSRHITRSILNVWFQWAEDQDRLDRNPMVGKVPTMRQPHRRPKDIFSNAEVDLLSSLPSPDGELWAILFGTGIRRGEARRLRLEHILFERRRLVVYEGKGDKDRQVPMFSSALLAAADLERLEGLGVGDHLWYITRGKRRLRRDPIGDTTFERWYRKGIEAAGVRYLNPHQTRHTHGHMLRERGIDIEERQQVMGHESIATTQKYYGRVTIEDVVARYEELGL